MTDQTPQQPSFDKPEGAAQQPPAQPSYGQAPPPQQAYGQQPPQGYGQPGPGAPQSYGTGPGAEMAPQEQRQWAMFAHLSGLINLFGGWAIIVTLILYVVNKDKGRFVREQSAEALNFQITLLIGTVIGWLTSWLIIGFFLLAVVWVGGAIFAILAGLAANKGENYRYPMTIRMVT